MDLLEREGPLAVLESELGEAASGHGRLVLVAGEAGIGKSSVAREFTARHAGDAHVWWGACDALSTPRPLGPLHDIARVAGGDLAALMTRDAARYDRFSGFLDALISPLRPVVVVIEDVHWADEATRDLLIFTGRRVATTNALLIVTYRDDEVSGDHPLRVVLGQLATVPSTRRVALAPLSAAAIAELARHPADAEWIYRVTGGNPFFVTELIAAGKGSVPDTVGDAVLSRAARISRQARAVLDAASIVPDRAELGVIEAAVGADVGGVDECVQAGLLLAEPRAVRFRHELARLAIERAIPATRVPGLHMQALSYLRTEPGVDVARLAYHADRAGDHAALREYAPAAAEQASRLGAHREAASHYRRVINGGGDLPAREQAELFERFADELTAIDRETDAIDAGGNAIERWLELGELERAATVMSRRAYLQWGTGDTDGARDTMRAALALLDGRPTSAALATVYAYWAHLHMLAREIPDAIRLGEQAIQLAESFGEERLLARALMIVGAALWFADPDQAEVTLARALEVARQHPDDVVIGIVMRMLGSGGGEVRRYGVADHWLREGVRWCAEHDIDIHGDYCLAWSARSAFEQGRWSEAGSVAAELTGRLIEHAPTRIVALTVLGRLRVRRGDPDPHTPLDEAWQLATRTGDLQRMWPAAAGRAEAAWLAGRSELVQQLVTDTFDLAVRLGNEQSIGELGFWLWRAGVLTDPPDGAYAPYARQIRGDWQSAAADWRRIGCPYEAAFALADSDDPEDLRTALEGFARLGARPMADRVAGRLRELGVRQLPRQPTRETVDNPGGLTERELEVLSLLAVGRTNAEIGATLHISPKTAGHHVSAILAKLGVSNRRDAARVASESGIVATEIGR